MKNKLRYRIVVLQKLLQKQKEIYSNLTVRYFSDECTKAHSDVVKTTVFIEETKILLKNIERYKESKKVFYEENAKSLESDFLGV
jgi:hypothetical protein